MKDAKQCKQFQRDSNFYNIMHEAAENFRRIQNSAKIYEYLKRF